MFSRLLLLFTIVPLIELLILVKIAMHIGFFYTMVIVVGTALLGAYLVKKEGLAVINRFKMSLDGGVFPEEEMLDGALILVAGALLVTPGVTTDFFGFMLVLPLPRSFIKIRLKRYLKDKMQDTALF